MKMLKEVKKPMKKMMKITKDKIKESYENLSIFFKLLKESLDRKFSVDQIIGFLKTLAKHRGIQEEIMPCLIQRFYDGIPCMILKENKKVTITSFDNKDITSKFPNIVKEIYSMDYEKLIIEAVIEKWEDGKIKDSKETLTYIKESKASKDNCYIANCLDIFWDPFNKADISLSECNHRLEIFSQISFKQSVVDKPNLKESRLNYAPTSFINTEKDFRKAFEYFLKPESSIGATVKHSNFTSSKYNTNVYTIIESKHSRRECMNCSRPPTVEVLWANGHGHAWFCDSDYNKWMSESDRDVASKKLVKDGEAAMLFKDNTNPNILKASRFVLQHEWSVNPNIESFNLLIDEGKMDLLSFSIGSNICECNDTTFYAISRKDKSWLNKGEKVEKILSSSKDYEKDSWLSSLDKGYVNIIESAEHMKVFEFFGSKLKGMWTAKKLKESDNFWEISKNN